MTLAYSLVVAVLFGTGAYLLLKHDLIRVAAGVVLVSNAANLFIIAAGLSRGVVPVLPIPGGESVADPVVQALVLTAIVISFGVSALLLSLVYRVYTSHLSLDLEDLSGADEEESEQELASLTGRSIGTGRGA
ncbi:MAG TPA: NADH-quinone oxidoreductase subunit K [Thermomicrobiales bacterium]|jgi:multicomponent Na+:H+ antiporter subunit C|nr:NADH-quinone oxidoreductase subunit K [Thermomicrobiales bacterium]